MKNIHSVLGVGAALLFSAIGIVGVMWLGIAAYMVVSGAPNSTRLGVAKSAAVAKGEPSADAGAATTSAASPSTTAPATNAVAQVSVEKGAKVFKKCKACHVAEAGAGKKTGPNLWNVVGRPVASTEGFKYSDAMSAKAGDVWTVDALRGFLGGPKAYVKGTSMGFAGLKKPAEIDSVLLFLGQQGDAPQDAAALGIEAAAVVAEAEGAVQDSAVEAVVEIDPVPYPEGVTYQNPPARSAEDTAAAEARAADLATLAEALDYERARFHPIHLPPMISEASNEECLACHKEILTHTPRASSPAGVAADATLAWYQTLDTYEGEQQSFHYRHLESDFAKQVMNLQCTFCHKGNDLREESPDMIPNRARMSASQSPEFTLRKMVNPSETCLRCHGSFPDPEIMGLADEWHAVREDMEWPEAPNGCLSCHAEGTRTVRHVVEYLNAKTIEKLAREGSSDTCYGCHGGRSWFRIPYPYPRHAWPEMDTEEETPDWAVNRPTESDPEYALPAHD